MRTNMHRYGRGIVRVNGCPPTPPPPTEPPERIDFDGRRWSVINEITFPLISQKHGVLAFIGPKKFRV